MARNTARPDSLDSDGRVQAAISLLGALTAAEDGTVSVQEYTQELSLSDKALEEVVGLLQLIADENTGARVAISRTDDEITLTGDAGRFEPVRFTSDEAIALTQILDRFHVNGETRHRIEAALAPEIDPVDRELLAGDPLFGGFFQPICEALTAGVRLSISYRALHDHDAAERIIDPGFLAVEGEAAYLVAWDVLKDEQRTYRLDRIEAVTFTDESVEAHDFTHECTGDSLLAGGEQAELRFANRECFERVSWAGLDRAHAIEDAEGVRATLSYASKPWLFAQILAAGGDIEILEPAALRSELVAYAQTLHVNRAPR